MTIVPGYCQPIPASTPVLDAATVSSKEPDMPIGFFALKEIYNSNPSNLISLNFAKIDIQNIFLILADHCKCEVSIGQIDENLSIGVNVKNIPWEKFYDIFLHINKLKGYKKDVGIRIEPPPFDSRKNPQTEKPIDDLKAVYADDKCGYVDHAGHFVIPLQFDTRNIDGEVCVDFSDGLAAVKLGHKYGYIDRTGKIAIPEQFDKAWSFFNGFAWVRVADQYSYINKTGQVVILPQRFDDFIWSYNNGLGWFRVENTYGYIDKNGRISPMVKVIRHTQPNLKMVLNTFDCQQIEKVPDYFGGLNPNSIYFLCITNLDNKRPEYPVLMGNKQSLDQSKKEWDHAMEEWKHATNEWENTFIYQEGCMDSRHIRYIAFLNGEVKLVSNKSELKAIVSPIESPEEALSYLLASTGESALYDINIKPRYTYFVDTIQDTHVTAVNDNEYLINLYKTNYCGCGNKETYEKVYKIKMNGDIEEVSKNLVFLDDEEACVD